ncbi:ABC transporter ATP-binding protein [Micromonospora sp. KC213]|uniref:ABC transporter ATP-binding protein n=1 Tax=Micromonospora sp. KC213 TaxID=2530378 RepID=UPI00104CA74A|nr:ABC transporter ATP-binding protein [Micromonospora sp. KC213]TDC38627.1 ABC transporter ATP-binding protein [Micromonospora sp. KC213]
MTASAMSVSGLSVTYGQQVVLDGVDLDLRPGCVHVVMGASGSGKTTLLRALIGMVPAPGRVSARRLLLRAGERDVDLSAPHSSAWRRVRGRHVGLIAQDPAQALTALRRVASLVREADRLTGGDAGRERVEQVLRQAGFADPRAVASRYCFELSGGMAQRLGVGLAIAPRPAVVLADEPSTALDGIARAGLAATLREMAHTGAAVVLVTHDVTLATGLADDVTVLHAGRVAEAGPASDILAAPQHEATRRLINGARPRPAAPAPHQGTGAGALSVRGLHKRYRSTGLVLDGVDLDVADGEVVGIAGRSGAGKTTLLRCLVGLERPDGGELRIAGRLPAEAGWRALRRLVQVVPQDPRASLNPWRTARELVADPLDAHRIGTRAERRTRAGALLDRVGLAGLGDRRPGQLSTGQCQRVAIARALALRPRLLIADEPVTALDAPLRQGVLDLLHDLVAEHDMAALVISHDLYVLEALCHRIAVLDAGRIVEDLPATALRDRGTHPLTRALIDCQPTEVSMAESNRVHGDRG